VTWSSSLDRLSDADLVVEAVVEAMTIKKAGRGFLVYTAR
jgi:3-hydroxyacyl-CoA dehydrogenase